MLSYLVDHIQMLGLRVREHLCCMAKVGIDLMTRHGVANRLATADRTRDCGNDGVLIGVLLSMVCQ